MMTIELRMRKRLVSECWSDGLSMMERIARTADGDEQLVWPINVQWGHSSSVPVRICLEGLGAY